MAGVVTIFAAYTPGTWPQRARAEGVAAAAIASGRAVCTGGTRYWAQGAVRSGRPASGRSRRDKWAPLDYHHRLRRSTICDAKALPMRRGPVHIPGTTLQVVVVFWLLYESSIR